MCAGNALLHRCTDCFGQDTGLKPQNLRALYLLFFLCRPKKLREIGILDRFNLPTQCLNSSESAIIVQKIEKRVGVKKDQFIGTNGR
jgi:hypothetical protein